MTTETTEREGFFPLTYEYNLPAEAWMLRNAVDSLKKNDDREFYLSKTPGGAVLMVKPVAPMWVGEDAEDNK